MQVQEPDTYVLATNRTTTIRDFVKMSAEAIGIDIFEGNGENEIAIDTRTNKTIVQINPAL